MKPNRPNKIKFLKDVASHEMTVLRDDGVDRHLRFRRPNTIVMGFDLITWPGFLCYTGDMGTYVFSRIPDMFEFFRDETGKMRINEGYWAEKVQAMDRHAQIEKYSPERFKEAVKQRLRDSDIPKGKSKAIREAVQRDVLSRADDGEFWAMQAAMEFNHEGFQLYDFWEANVQEYSYQFVWCCYALVYGIARYDQLTAKKAAA